MQLIHAFAVKQPTDPRGRPTILHRDVPTAPGLAVDLDSEVLDQLAVRPRPLLVAI
ncbi:MAG TPA: hypothetical protein VFG86_22790 [Chloroflexota bacterium]|jgi:hypothetical protein|nr:hypothetical protein [Chloroflexota bacterium]